jgi:hypothetical protein
VDRDVTAAKVTVAVLVGKTPYGPDRYARVSQRVQCRASLAASVLLDVAAIVDRDGNVHAPTLDIQQNAHDRRGSNE